MFLFAYVPVASACQWCRSPVDALIYGDGFWTNVGIAVLPFVVIAIVVAAVERYVSAAAQAPSRQRSCDLKPG